MYLYKPIFQLECPYVKLEKYRPFKKKLIYKTFDVGGNTITEKQKKVIDENRKVLLENRVPINKIRFVFHFQFTYDIDADKISPEYKVMLPVGAKDGLFDGKAPIIELDKPKNFMTIEVGRYRSDDNFLFLRSILKGNKRGIVIFLADKTVDTVFGEKQQFTCNVSQDAIMLSNLDAEVVAYKRQSE